MKEYLIGRGLDADIVIPDETDQVSRHHCYLRISFFGRMQLCDDSTNGTFINGETMEKGEWRNVSRKDKVSLAKVWELDWDEVPHPYRKPHILLAALLIAALIFGCFMAFSSPKTAVLPVDSTSVAVGFGGGGDAMTATRTPEEATTEPESDAKEAPAKQDPAINGIKDRLLKTTRTAAENGDSAEAMPAVETIL